MTDRVLWVWFRQAGWWPVTRNPTDTDLAWARCFFSALKVLQHGKLPVQSIEARRRWRNFVQPARIGTSRVESKVPKPKPEQAGPDGAPVVLTQREAAGRVGNLPPIHERVSCRAESPARTLNGERT